MTLDDDERPLREEDLVRLERSLAMAPTLPGDAGRRLIGEIRRLRVEQLDTAETVNELLAELTRAILDALSEPPPGRTVSS